MTTGALQADMALITVCVHVTNTSARKTISRVTGGMNVKTDMHEPFPCASMLAAQDVASRRSELGIVHIIIQTVF